MGLCIDLGYEVVSKIETIPDNNGSLPPHVISVTAPSGKKPICGSVDFGKWNASPFRQESHHQLIASRPSGDDWVFEIRGASTSLGYDVTVYVVCVNV